jgi:hypothetical protein
MSRLSQIREEHPDWSEEDVELFAQMLEFGGVPEPPEPDPRDTHDPDNLCVCGHEIWIHNGWCAYGKKLASKADAAEEVPAEGLGPHFLKED